MLAGSSDAAWWLGFAIDDLAAEVRTVAAANGVQRVGVYVVLDAFFDISIDGAWRDVAASQKLPPQTFTYNMLANPYWKTLLCVLPDNGDGVPNEACSDATYRVGPTGGIDERHYMTFRDTLDVRGVRLNPDCLLAHPTDYAPCYDHIHSLIHHTTTPILIIAGQKDHTIGKMPVVYSDGDRLYRWADPDVFRSHILAAARDIEKYWATAAREGGPGVPGNLAFMLPNDDHHVYIGSGAWLQKKMTKCLAPGIPPPLPPPNPARSVADMIEAFVNFNPAGPPPPREDVFVYEDGPGYRGGVYWVTDSVRQGAPCPPPK